MDDIERVIKKNWQTNFWKNRAPPILFPVYNDSETRRKNKKNTNHMPLYQWKAFNWDLDERTEPSILGESCVQSSRNFKITCSVWLFRNMRIPKRYVPADQLSKWFFTGPGDTGKVEEKQTKKILRGKSVTDVFTLIIFQQIHKLSNFWLSSTTWSFFPFLQKIGKRTIWSK